MTPSQTLHAIASTKADFLDLLLQRGPHTLDAVPIPDRCDDGRNPWRGTAIGELRKDGLIVADGTANSTSKKRQGAVLRRWRILDEDAARKYLQTLRDWLIVNRWPEDPPAPPAGSRQAIGKALAEYVGTLQVQVDAMKHDCDVIDADHGTFDKLDERLPYWNASNNITAAIEDLAALANRLQSEGGAA